MLIYLLYIEKEEDRSFFEDIFYKYRKQMVYFAFSYVSNETDAEDIVHDVFLKIAQKHLKVLRKINNESDIRNYLLKATKNTALNLAKTQNKAVPLEDETLDDISDKDFIDAICSKMEYDKIVSSINSLGEAYKTALYYHFVLDLSVKDTANLLGRSVTATKKQLIRGKKLLLNCLRREDL